MIQLSKSGNTVTFTFDENSGYLQNGTIDVPVNSLSLILDESNMATFRKSASNDIFVSANIAEFGMSKSDLETWYKNNMVSSGGGGGSGGTTPEEVQEMIDESISGKADTSAVTESISGLTSRLSEDEEVTARALIDINDLSENKADVSALTEVAEAVASKADVSAVTAIDSAVSGLTERVGEDEQVTARALVDLDTRKLDASAYTPSDYSAGRGISIDSGNTISVRLPISAGTGTNSIREGYTGNTASGNYSHAEGNSTSAISNNSHAEGNKTLASDYSSHAEGNFTSATSNSSHAEGYYTIASGYSSHAEGSSTSAINYASHAEGISTIASGMSSHAEGQGTIANNDSEHASGQYNVSTSASTTFGDSGNTLFSVGNGTAEYARHNAFEIRQNGDIYLTSGGTDIKLQDHLGGGGGSGITSGEVQTMIDNSISGKQDTLISGTNIKTINNISLLGSGNIDIQGGGGTGTCTVDETTIYDIYSGSYNNYKFDLKVRYFVLDYVGDKTEANNVGVSVQFRDDNYNYYVNQTIYLDYTTSSYTLSDQSQEEYLDITYDPTIEDFKIAVASAYTSTVFVETIGSFLGGYIKIPFYTISSGSPCTVIENDVTGAIAETRDSLSSAIRSVYLTSSKTKININYEPFKSDGSNSNVNLDEIDGSNGTLKPDIYVGLGTSGWTEIDISQNQFVIDGINIIKFRVTYDYSEFNANNMNLQLYVNYAQNATYNSITFDENTQLPSLQADEMFSAATLEWSASTKELVVTYPLTVEWSSEQVPVYISQIYSNASQFGQTITKLESYGEDKQALKPYVQQNRAALGGLKLVKLTQAEYDALSPNYDNNTVYFIGDSNGYSMKIGTVNVN